MLRNIVMIAVGGVVLIVSLVLFTATVGILLGEPEPDVAVPQVAATEQPELPEQSDVAAMIRCPPQIQRLAAYSYRWTDGLLGSKFSATRPTTNPNVVTYLGDTLEFQMETGAWFPVVYECDYNFASEQVVDARARPGRLPASR